MASRLEIGCIVPNEADRDRRIAAIAGTSGRQRGGRWRVSIDDAIGGIEAGHWSFWITHEGRPVAVIVATRNGRKYLKAEGDGAEPEALLGLPRCP